MPRKTSQKREAERVDIGARIRKLRAKREMTMEQVASSAGCSRAFLSRVERNESLPSVVTLVGIANALGVSPGHFFDVTDAEQAVVLRTEERSRIEDRGVVAELVTRDVPTRKMLMTRLTVPTGCQAQARRHKYDDDQCGICLQGAARIVTEHSVFELGAEDTFYFSSPIPYRIENAGTEPVVILIVAARRSF